MNDPVNAPGSGPFVLMHISDLHLHRLPRHPFAYASKRILGAANLVLRRRRRFPPGRAEALVAHLAGLPWDHLLISGDLTQLGTREEFERVRQALQPLLDRGRERITLMPGNHDRYVPEPPGRGAFEAVFPEFAPGGEILTRRLTDRWWMAVWDSAQAAPWLSAAGRVRPETLRATAEWMNTLPPEARVIVANHYPVFFPPPHRHSPRHDLTNRTAVRQWLLHHPVPLYLHGHIHHNWVHSEEGAHGTITAVNSASSTQRLSPARAGKESSYHRIVLDGPEFRIEPQRFP